MASIKIRVDGLDELRAAVRRNDGEPYREAYARGMGPIAEAAAAAVRRAAPVLTGRLRDSVRPRVMPGRRGGLAVPRVEVTARRSGRGERDHPKLLEFGGQVGRRRLDGGRRPPNRHRNKLHRAAAAVDYTPYLERIAAELERSWDRIGG